MSKLWKQKTMLWLILFACHTYHAEHFATELLAYQH